MRRPRMMVSTVDAISILIHSRVASMHISVPISHQGLIEVKNCIPEGLNEVKKLFSRGGSFVTS
jgi:hypothetical protein